MKKIVSAVAIAAAAASLATAEVTVSQNVRVRPELYKATFAKDNSDSDTTAFADLNGYDAAKDTLALKASNDNAGLAVELTVLAGADGNANGSITVDNYMGWMKFGNFKMSAGVFDLRATNRGNYTATEEGILDKEFNKGMGPAKSYGSAGSKADSKAGSSAYPAVIFSNFENVVQVGGGNQLSFLAEYPINDVGGGTLTLRGGLVENSTYTICYADVNEDGNPTYKEYSFSTYDGSNQSAGWVAEAVWAKKELAQVDVIFKNPLKNVFGAGVYVTPLMVGQLKNFVIGGMYGTNTDAEDGEIESTMAADLRFTVDVNEQAKFALGAKWEQTKCKSIDAESAMQVAAEFSYKVNDTVTVAFDAGYFNTDLDDNDKKDSGEQSFVAALRAKFSANANAAVTTALRLNKVLNDGDMSDTATVTTFDIPVIFRVKF